MARPTRIAFTWLDVLVFSALVTCGVAAWTVASPSMRRLTGDTPGKEAYDRRHLVATRRADLKAVEDELAAARTKLIETRLAVIQHRTTLAYLETVAVMSLEEADRASHRARWRDEEAALAAGERLLRALAARLDGLHAQADEAATALREAERRATRERDWDVALFNLKRALIGTATAAAVTAVVFLGVCGVVRVGSSRAHLGPGHRLATVGAAIVLAVVFAYDFGGRGGAIVAVVLALLALLEVAGYGQRQMAAVAGAVAAAAATQGMTLASSIPGATAATTAAPGGVPAHSVKS